MNIQPKELTQDQMGNREIIRTHTQRGEEIVKIPLSKIVVRDGFNVRQDYGDIEGLASSILENGQTLPGRVDVLLDGTFILTDGHRRYKACCLLSEKGTEPLFKAIVNNTKTTEEQRILQMFTTQDNKPLSPQEISELISRLINLGYNQSTVAKKIGKTPAYISQMLSFSNESIIIKEHVSNGEINISTVMQLQKDIPIQSERVKAVSDAVKIKKDIGNTKALTVKDVTGIDKKDQKIINAAKEISERYSLTDVDEIINIIKNNLHA